MGDCIQYDVKVIRNQGDQIIDNVKTKLDAAKTKFTGPAAAKYSVFAWSTAGAIAAMAYPGAGEFVKDHLDSHTKFVTDARDALHQVAKIKTAVEQANTAC